MRRNCHFKGDQKRPLLKVLLIYLHGYPCNCHNPPNFNQVSELWKPHEKVDKFLLLLENSEFFGHFSLHSEKQECSQPPIMMAGSNF